MKETRTLTRKAFRNLCIENNWYTDGDNEDYADILSLIDRMTYNGGTIITSFIAMLARNVKAHSIEEDSNTSLELTDICSQIASACVTSFEI